MELVDVIVIAVIVLVIGAAVAYIIKQKRSGKKCIGCPDSASCSGNCSACSGCRPGKPSTADDGARDE